MDYYKTDEIEVNGLNEQEIDKKYAQGYVLTRIGKMQQTRSLRVNLEQFEPSSENRRVLRKAEDLEIADFSLPLPENDSNWQIHSLGKTFYSEKFDDVIFSASKIRELILTNKNKFNSLFVYYFKDTFANSLTAISIDHTKTLGYAICYKSKELIHYSYPFYDLEQQQISLLGMSMMLKAILWAKESGLGFIYLGSYTRPTDKYKLQFKGLEWYDGQSWQKSLDKLKTFV